MVASKSWRHYGTRWEGKCVERPDFKELRVFWRWGQTLFGLLLSFLFSLSTIQPPVLDFMLQSSHEATRLSFCLLLVPPILAFQLLRWNSAFSLGPSPSVSFLIMFKSSCLRTFLKSWSLNYYFSPTFYLVQDYSHLISHYSGRLFLGSTVKNLSIYSTAPLSTL